MFAAIWRLLVAVFDWRTLLRHLTGRPSIDVVFITNMRDEVDRKRFLGRWRPSSGHFNGPRYWFGNVIGRTRALDVTAAELMTSDGRKKAKEQFLSAVEWAYARGARVVLLAAGTKRLFGAEGKLLKERFPDVLFTIGDNGTAFLLCGEVLTALRRSYLMPRVSRVLVIGPTGILGSAVVTQLLTHGYTVAGLSTRKNLVEGLETYAEFGDVGPVDAVIACSHSETARLTKERVNLLRKGGQKLLVVDVAEPSNMDAQSYEQCQSVVVRQDAGNAYSEKLSYVLGAVSYRLFRLTRGVTFGCFAEAMTIAEERLCDTEDSLQQIDWFTVSDETRGLVSRLFGKHGFSVPSPRCFGRKIDSFDLNL